MRFVAFIVATAGTIWCFQEGHPWLSFAPLLLACGILDRHGGMSGVKHKGKTFSPDTTIADEGDFEDIPIAGADRSWRLEYHDVGGDDTTRDITLKALRKKQGHYYLLAFCHKRKAMRSFRLDRIASSIDLATGEVFDSGSALLNHLSAPSTSPSQFNGKRIAIYGPLTHIEYHAARKTIEALGAISYGGNATKSLDFVIAGEKCSAKKVAQAQKLGARVLSEAEWLQMTDSLSN